MDSHSVSKALDLVWIGNGIKVWSNGAAGTEIMYKKEASVRNVETLDLDASLTYFMSSEALCSYDYMVEALAKRFRIVRTVLTVRMPVPLVMSEYCWSGWLYKSPWEINLLGRCKSLAAVSDRLSNLAPVILCPIEPDDFFTRFSECVAGRASPDIKQISNRAGNVNVSIPPSLAAALRAQIVARKIPEISGPNRRVFVSAAMENRGSETFNTVVPDSFSKVFRDEAAVEAELAEYDDLLAKGRVSAAVRAEAVARGRLRLQRLAQMPNPSKAMASELLDQANLILDHVQESCPELTR